MKRLVINNISIPTEIKAILNFKSGAKPKKDIVLSNFKKKICIKLRKCIISIHHTVFRFDTIKKTDIFLLYIIKNIYI